LIKSKPEPLRLLYIVVCFHAGGTPVARLNKTRKENRKHHKTQKKKKKKKKKKTSPHAKKVF
jgi:hypothetical protein